MGGNRGRRRTREIKTESFRIEKDWPLLPMRCLHSVQTETQIKKTMVNISERNTSLTYPVRSS